MDFLQEYLKELRRPVLVFFTFAAVFAVSFALYHLPLMAALYPTMLCAAAGGVFLLVDFIRKRRKYRELSRLATLPYAEIVRFPTTESAAETGYQAVIRALTADAAERDAEAVRRFRDTVDYYTVWAHQIKTPITGMSLALEDEDTPLARRLRAGLFQIRQYVGMVLAYLRLDSESTDYVFREQSLSDIVDGALSPFAPEFIDRHLTLDYTPSDLTVVTDGKWLAFVIEQLLSNALKYTKEGGIRIFTEEPCVLRISDTGIGIDAADLPRVFEKGYTGAAGHRDSRSSGIGLYLVKRVCDELGIGIGLSSSPGAGTTVSLDFEQYKLKAE